MDPIIINETLFSAANPSSYSLGEIWQFPINGNSGISGLSGGLGLRMSNLSGFAEVTSNRDVSIEESTVTEQSGSRGAGGGRKRRDSNSGDESSKLVSTSSGNDLLGVLTFNAAGMAFTPPETREYKGSQPMASYAGF